jgi:hypothetical protein
VECLVLLLILFALIFLQVFCGNGGEKLAMLAEGLLKKHVASHSLHEPEGEFHICCQNLNNYHSLMISSLIV